MFGLSFVFGAALLALPLAGLPILLHMLYRRKSPILLFSTLRFVKTSLQQTAARRRIQRWVLLACRILLLAFLIWAIAQPQRTPRAMAASRGGPSIAAIVVDTSYSMLLKEDQLTLLDRANEIVGDLLREPLKDARVVIYRSAPSDEERQAPPNASAILANWVGLSAQSSSVPLSQRVADAADFLSHQPDQRKWLVVISDLQSRKFSTPLPKLDGVRTILFDLHPTKGNSHGITAITVNPQQPLPGSKPDIGFDVVGRSGGEPRFASFHLSKLDGQDAAPPFMNLKADFAAGGKAHVQVPAERELPAERWLLLSAKLDGEDDMAWDDQRSYLLELPLKQPVTFIDANPALDCSRVIWPLLSLHSDDPQHPWLLDAKKNSDLTGREQAAVIICADWPDKSRALRLRDFATRGGNVVLLLQPGIEQSWEKLPSDQRDALAEILPANVSPTLAGGAPAGRGLFVPVPPPDSTEPIVGDMLESLRREPPTVRRFVPFSAPTDPSVSTLLYLAAKGEDSRSAQFGLWFRRGIGSGCVYTIASLPEERFMTPGVPWNFPMQIIKSCMRRPDRSDAQNVEIGQSISLALTWHHIDKPDAIRLVTPKSDAYEYHPDREEGKPFILDENTGRLTYPNTSEPGLYRWFLPGQDTPIAVSNVQYPSADSELNYREADSLAGADSGWLTIRREGNQPYLDKLQQEMKKVTEPIHIWTWFIAIVVILICLEAMLASMSNLWKPLAMKWMAQKPAEQPAEV